MTVYFPVPNWTGLVLGFVVGVSLIIALAITMRRK